MKHLFLLVFLMYSTTFFAVNYYVNPLGNNNNNGLTVGSAFQTLTYAADQTVPGDTVYVMNGIYTNPSPSSNVMDIYNSGTASSRITYVNLPGHTPIIKLNANNWSGIGLQGADYITIDGFQIIGNNDVITVAYALAEQLNTNNPATSGNGVGITWEYNNVTNKPHHNIIRNCSISKCGGAGIYGYGADYTTIENNTISECAWYSPYGNSGISLYQCWNSDGLDSVKNFIVGNTCYRNENYVPFIAVGNITDGNGIIIDDGRNTQNSSTLGVYLGKTYIANNLIYDNGGRGIHVYLSDNVTIVNNTCFANCQSPAIQDGEYAAYDTESVSIINNIAFPSTNIPPIDTFLASNLWVDHNLWATNATIANPLGTNFTTGNPNVVLASNNPSIADFRLQSTSNAINAGTSLNAPLTDKDGNQRTFPFDLGCYEYQLPLSTPENTNSENTLIVYPNPASNRVNIKLRSEKSVDVELHILGVKGQLIKKEYIKTFHGLVAFDVSELNLGIYLIKILDDYNNYPIVKLIKVQE